MRDLFEKIALIVIGGCVTYIVQRIIAWRNEKRATFRHFRLAFRGFPEFHRNLFYEGMTQEIWENKIPPRLRDHCITFVFFLHSVGRAVTKDLRITVDANNDSGIVTHQFLVERSVICDRLEVEQIEDKRIIAKWKYINPGEELELHLLVTGIDNPEDIEIGVDAEGIELQEQLLLQKTIDSMIRAGQPPMDLRPKRP